MPATVDAATLRAKIEATGADKAKKDIKDVGDAADKAKGHLSGMGAGFSTLKDAFMGGLGSITGAITGFLGYKAVGDVLGFVKDQLLDVMQAGMDQQKIDAQTAAVIKSTGAAAGLSADQIGDMADSLARLTGISDDDIQSAENILLTFKAIGKQVFPDATQATLDMSVALHQGLQQSAILVGKALQDPILGVTSLRRVGVQLTDQQAQLVKQFMATGQKAKAQAVIIGELTSEFGGSAEAAGKTFPGELARLGVSFDQMKEKVGLAVIPVLESLTTKYLMPAADWIGDHLPAAIQVLTSFLDNQLVPAINDFMDSPMVKVVEGWANSITGTLTPALDDKKGGLAHTANQATGALGEKGLTGAGDKAKGSLKSLSGQAKTTGTDIDPTMTGHINAGITSITNLTDAIDPKGTGDKTSHALVPAMRRADDQFTQMDKNIQYSSEHTMPAWEQAMLGPAAGWDGLGEHIHGAGNALGDFKDAVISRFGDSLRIQNDILKASVGSLGNWGFNFQNIWEGVWGALSAPVQAGFHSVEGAYKIGLDILGDLTTHKWDNIRQDWLDMMAKITGDVQQFVNGLKRIGEGLPPWLRGAMGPVNWSGQQRAGGGPTSGPFLGAEKGVELLVTPGIYHAPPGSYVYNNQQTQQMLSGSGSGGVPLRGGVTNVYNITATSNDQNTARAIARTMRRRELLAGMGA